MNLEQRPILTYDFPKSPTNEDIEYQLRLLPERVYPRVSTEPSCPEAAYRLANGQTLGLRQNEQIGILEESAVDVQPMTVVPDTHGGY